jgi:hypothetical protein
MLFLSTLLSDIQEFEVLWILTYWYCTDLGPALFVSDFQDVNKKKYFFPYVFLLITFWSYICIILQR